MSFYIAMQNYRAIASYLHPRTILIERSEFLIVKRSGEGNDFLSISTAGFSTGTEIEAPSRLRPSLAIFATLVGKGPDESELFIVEKALPDGQSSIGQHMSGDGFVFLHQTDSEIRLGGVVRIKPDAQDNIPQNFCPLIRANEAGIVVHFEAKYIPWSRELLPSGYQGDHSVEARS